MAFPFCLKQRHYFYRHALPLREIRDGEKWNKNRATAVQIERLSCSSRNDSGEEDM